jgi:serine/threonine-protein kinase
MAAPIVRRPHRWVTGRAIVLAAGALATAVLATIVTAGGGQRDAAVPEPPSTTATQAASSGPPQPASSAPLTTAAAALPTRATPLDQITGLATLLQRQADIGHLQPKAAKTLVRDLNDVVRRLSAGKTDQAAEKFAEFRDRVSELSTDGELTAAGSDALPDLDQIAESLRAG